ncbi:MULTISPECIES: NADH-quinone oxidoreductase subunit J [Anaeromyxobacter]|uniref:NADH-quinone oxidoreductase subunit J n=1 Tax=Anaeromyxobacter TaxID=161492 RepID=UPI001F566CD0|nr:MULTISPECIES: NADH-quinone oxidoreductase subunit J [unclassified Anaeromyxobacter]
MQITAELVCFWIFAIPLVVTALGVVVARSPVYAAMNLVAAFFFMAGLYVLLAAHLIAFMQILVYAGAVMVLFLFVIMLLSLDEEHPQRERRRAMQYVGVLGAVSLLAVLASAIARVPDAAMSTLAQPDRFGTVKAVGQVLYTEFLLPFEVTSLLLLVAIVGAVVVAKERI